MSNAVRQPARTATPEEIAEDIRRGYEARERIQREAFATKPAPAPLPPLGEKEEGNLCAALVYFATWRPCARCGLEIVAVDSNAKTIERLACNECLRLANATATPARLPMVKTSTSSQVGSLRRSFRTHIQDMAKASTFARVRSYLASLLPMAAPANGRV